MRGCPTADVVKALHGDFANPLTTVGDAVEGAFDGRVGTAMHAVALVLLVVLVVVVFRRWPLSYGLFASVVVASAVTSETSDSLERYALFAFPLVLAAPTSPRRASSNASCS